jgi:hypothetical protein
MPMAKIALCLSGGGFRASLFHLGVLRRLHELDLVKHIHLISAVSGGAVTAAAFKQHTDIEFDEFERRLLRVTRLGLLGNYMRSMAIYSFLLITAALLILQVFLPRISFSYIAPSWSGGLLLTLAALSLMIAVCLYVSLVSASWHDTVGRRERLNDVLRLRKNPSAVSVYNQSQLPSLFLALLKPFSPNAMRAATLDRELFSYDFLGFFPPPPQIYLGTVELNRGCEMVFSSYVLAELSSLGSAALWEQMPYLGTNVEFNRKQYGYPFQTSYDCTNFPVSDAVVASSAYPPFFWPITIWRNGDHPLVGSFIDGGVLDNAALNAPLAMLVHCSERRQRYQKPTDEFGRRTTFVGFGEMITHLMVANAGARPVNAARRWWSSWKSLRRSVDAMYNHQEANVDLKLELLRMNKIQTVAIATWVSIPGEDQLADDRIGDCLARVRTHFDRFDDIETVLLVYFGYYWTDKALGHLAEGSSRRRNFREVASAVTGSDAIAKLSCDDIVNHLAWSHRRFAFHRTVGRWLGH